MLYCQAPEATDADSVVKLLTNRYLWVVVTSLEKDLLKTLVELDVAVKAMPNPKLNLLRLFARIDELAKQLPHDTDPALLHYLRKKSYEKARLFLKGRDAENQIGNCWHV
jgi:hypothetical protein